VTGFGELVRQARYAARLTQEQLADRSGVSVRTIVDLERGQVRRPRADTVRRIAVACGLNAAQREQIETAGRDGLWRDRIPVSSPHGPAELPPDLAGFTGRTRELAELDAALAASGTTAPVIVVLSGTAGVGKTALAVHWAHRVAGRFPDGQLHVNLRGFDPAGPAREPDDVVRGFLDTLETPPERIPADPAARVARYRSMVAGRRLLVVLDNARDAAQVRPLLPGTGSAMVVVTSRDVLTGLVAGEAARPVPVAPLDPDQARALFAARLRREPHPAEGTATAEIVARCAGLPLALAVAAARVATGTDPAALAEELATAGGGLGPLTGTDPATDLRAVLGGSYRALDPAAARLFRLLALHPGTEVSEPAAASLAGWPVERARPVLGRLVRAHLLTGCGPGRYTWHDLLRAYATELSEMSADSAGKSASSVSSGDVGDARLRLFDHLLHTAYAADRLIIPSRFALPLEPPVAGVALTPPADRDAAVAWFTVERPTLVAAVPAAAAAGQDRHAWQLAWASLEYLDRWGHWSDAITTHEVALAAAERLEDPGARALTHRGLGRAYGRLGRLDEAEAQLGLALVRFDQLGSPAGSARTHLSLAGLAERRQRFTDALRHAEQALTLFRRAPWPIGIGNALGTVAWYHSLLGDHASAVALGRQALAVLEPLDDRYGLAGTWADLGIAYHGLGSYPEAAGCLGRAVDLHRANGDRHNEADALDRLGDTYQASGDRPAARQAWTRAADLFTELDHPAAGTVRAKLPALDAGGV
jgi:tetratricopeptide (TPR) repeat protein/transcriptional regulator with XRE-family HTH domain